MSITLIIPAYRNPNYLDLCLKSATENRKLDSTEIIVVIDGYISESAAVIEKYKNARIGVIELEHNGGFANAINMGVWNANTDIVFLANEDNVFPKDWDAKLTKYDTTIVHNNTIITVNQIEPSPSIFGFPIHNFGVSVETFDYEAFIQKEEELSKPELTMDGRIFPFLISKRDYMKIGGFDLWYKSPFWSDCDFFLKLELCGNKFFRTHSCHLYHFGGRSTKMGPEGQKFRASESVASQQFLYQWGFLPNIVENVFRNNTKIPAENPTIKGITF